MYETKKRKRGNDRMSLQELIQRTTVQGHIRLSVWDDDDVISVKSFRYVDDLGSVDIDEYEHLEIIYIFAGSDGFLHIELIRRGR